MRARLFACALFALLLISTPAEAWYFPEHVVLSSDGHAALAPELRAIIAAAVSDARKEGLSLCEATELRLEDALQNKPLLTPMLRTPATV